MDAALKRRIEHVGATPSQAAEEVGRKRAMMPRAAVKLLMLGIAGPYNNISYNIYNIIIS